MQKRKKWELNPSKTARAAGVLFILYAAVNIIENYGGLFAPDILLPVTIGVLRATLILFLGAALLLKKTVKDIPFIFVFLAFESAWSFLQNAISALSYITSEDFSITVILSSVYFLLECLMFAFFAFGAFWVQKRSIKKLLPGYILLPLTFLFYLFWQFISILEAIDGTFTEVAEVITSEDIVTYVTFFLLYVLFCAAMILTGIFLASKKSFAPVRPGEEKDSLFAEFSERVRRLPNLTQPFFAKIAGILCTAFIAVILLWWTIYDFVRIDLQFLTPNWLLPVIFVICAVLLFGKKGKILALPFTLAAGYSFSYFLYAFVYRISKLKVLQGAVSGIALATDVCSLLDSLWLFLTFLLLAAGFVLNTRYDISKYRPAFVLVPVLYFLNDLVLNIISTVSFSDGSEWYEAVLSFFTGFLLSILLFTAFILAGNAAVDKKAKTAGKNVFGAKTGREADGYIPIGIHIILLLFTFGIWNLIWIYKTTAFLNKTRNAEHCNPVSNLLLCMFVPFYFIFWYYKQGGRVDAYANTKNMHQSGMATTCLLLAIFLPFVACIVLQDRLNKVCAAKPQPADFSAASYVPPAVPNMTPSASQTTTAPVSYVPYTASNAAPSAQQTVYAPASYAAPAASYKPAAQQTANSFEDIKQFKELLDNGIITQEEFEAKKKELLHL